MHDKLKLLFVTLIVMHEFEMRPEGKEFRKFQKAISPQVNAIGKQRRSTMRTAQGVADRLYKATGGDATKVTEDDVVRAYEYFEAIK